MLELLALWRCINQHQPSIFIQQHAFFRANHAACMGTQNLQQCSMELPCKASMYDNTYKGFCSLLLILLLLDEFVWSNNNICVLVATMECQMSLIWSGIPACIFSCSMAPLPSRTDDGADVVVAGAMPSFWRRILGGVACGCICTGAPSTPIGGRGGRACTWWLDLSNDSWPCILTLGCFRSCTT